MELHAVAHPMQLARTHAPRLCIRKRKGKQCALAVIVLIEAVVALAPTLTQVTALGRIRRRTLEYICLCRYTAACIGLDAPASSQEVVNFLRAAVIPGPVASANARAIASASGPSRVSCERTRTWQPSLQCLAPPF